MKKLTKESIRYEQMHRKNLRPTGKGIKNKQTQQRKY